MLGVYEETYPTDSRPRKAIEAAKAWLANPASASAEATYAAAYDAYAAAKASHVAAYAANAAAYADASAAPANIRGMLPWGKFLKIRKNKGE